MILLTVLTPSGPKLAVRLPEGVLICEQARFLLAASASVPRTLDEAITSADGLDKVRTLVDAAIEKREEITPLLRPEEQLQVDLPFRPRNVICVGLNYRKHAEESGKGLPAEPLIFAKWTNSIIGPKQPIMLTGQSKEVDFEAELAVVIGRRCRRVPASEALNYVAGYTCLNDVSARDFQRADKQWVRAKSQDTFGPMGPYLVTSDEVPDPQSLRIRCFLNGKAMQDSNTRDMIFSLQELIAYISHGITLEPGDVISTGTPEGVGFARNPPVFLKGGDEVVVEIDGVGSLSNGVREMVTDARGASV